MSHLAVLLFTICSSIKMSLSVASSFWNCKFKITTAGLLSQSLLLETRQAKYKEICKIKTIKSKTIFTSLGNLTSYSFTSYNLQFYKICLCQ